MIGFTALFSNESAECIALNHQISRSYVYDLMGKAKSVFDHMLEAEDSLYPLITINENFIQKSILSLSLNCRASLEGIQRHMEELYGVHIAIGKISDILKKLGQKADEYHKSIDLSHIQQTANDEIFQRNQPVLTTVDLVSTFIVNMEPCEDRSSNSWNAVMESRKEQGFYPRTSISDGGSGLLCGIPQAFPEIELRKDVFHAIRAVGIEVSKFERAAYARIEEEFRMIQATSGTRVHKKTVKKLSELQSHLDSDLIQADRILLLYQWAKELLGFNGYPSYEVTETLHWICKEMLAIVPDRKQFRKQIHVFEDNIEQTVAFLHYLEKNMKEAEKRNKWRKGSLQALYQVKTYYHCREEKAEWNFHCDTLFGFDSEKRAAAEKKLNELIKNTYRASSMIENVNGRIRDYIDSKRTIPPNYFPLLQLYMNTKKYRRSSVTERKGKSPLELLSGKEHGTIYQILGLE